MVNPKNNKLSCAILLLSSLLYFTYAICQQETLYLRWIKNSNWSLEQDFLQHLARMTNADTFIETGTYAGGTTFNASSIFGNIYTVELSEQLYAAAVQRFSSNKKVHVYCGGSPQILSKILPDIRGNIIFWLDAHYSSGNTAKDEVNTPVLQELEAIRASGIKDATILIDDIRQFDKFSGLGANDLLVGYPTVQELFEALYMINKDYYIDIYGDIAIARPNANKFIVSPVVHACTISRSFNAENYSIEDVLGAEQVIAHAKGQEANAIFHLCDSFGQTEHGAGKYYDLWQGLILMQSGDYSGAIAMFTRAYVHGLTHWRISMYIVKAATITNASALAHEHSLLIPLAYKNKG